MSDYKEKYEAALQTAKWWIADGCSDKAKIALECVFPELREGENKDNDERIRKLILEKMEASRKHSNFYSDEEVAWVEKQKDSIPYEKYVEDIAVINAEAKTKYHAGWNDGYEAKQKEQKEPEIASASTIMIPSCWEEKQKPAEDSDFKTKLASYMEKNQENGRYALSSESILEMAEEELLKRGVVQKPAEWNKKGKEIIDWACCYLGDYAASFKDKNERKSNMLYELSSKLNSLRPQPQGTFKQVIHTIFGMLKDKDFYEIQPSHRVSLLNDIRVKCKDAIECAPILDEPHWKPRETQMNALEHALEVVEEELGGCEDFELRSLVADLKKLMED